MRAHIALTHVTRQSHPAAQLILLSNLAAFNLLLTVGLVFAYSRSSIRASLALLIMLALLWDLWLVSVMNWLRGVKVEIEDGGDDERSTDLGVRRV